jgi:hypothetical protein
MGIPGALDDLTAKALDLISGHATKVVVERIARFELFAVDQERVGARKRISGGFVKVAKQREPTALWRNCAVVVLAMKPGDEIVN